MLQGLYTVDVYELRTHDKVASYAVAGDKTDCPESLGGDLDDLYSTISASLLREKLAAVVSR